MRQGAVDLVKGLTGDTAGVVHLTQHSSQLLPELLRLISDQAQIQQSAVTALVNLCQVLLLLSVLPPIQKIHCTTQHHASYVMCKSMSAMICGLCVEGTCTVAEHAHPALSGRELCVQKLTLAWLPLVILLSKRLLQDAATMQQLLGLHVVPRVVDYLISGASQNDDLLLMLLANVTTIEMGSEQLLQLGQGVREGFNM